MNTHLKVMAASVLAAGICGLAYFYGTGLHPRWYLTWAAPLPILVLAVRVPLRPAMLAAFAAFVLGGLNMWNYYRLIIPVAAAVFVLLAPALVFAGLICLFRFYALRGQIVRAALIVPALWSAVEYLSEFRSPNGTFGNFAYTQMDFLPLIQIAAITGIWGISFLLFLLPSALAALTAPNAAPRQKMLVALGTLVVFAAALGYGFQRLHTGPRGGSVTVGLLDTDAPTRLYPTGPDAVALLRRYAAQVPALAAQGAQVVVLPEKIGRFNDRETAQADQILGPAAEKSQVTIVAGFRHLPNLNELRVYAQNGALEATYEKHHMLAGFETGLRPGTTRLVLDRPSGSWGVTICKDMDFPALSRQYGRSRTGLLLVPAWDFGADGWLHGRMSLLRGVESGFSIARAAKQGTLTVTDNRGRVLAEQATETAASFSFLSARAPTAAEQTFYDRAGDWFAWLNLVLATALLWPARKAKSHSADCSV